MNNQLILDNVSYYNTSTQSITSCRSMVLEDGIIAEINPTEAAEGKHRIDCDEKYVFPGFIDSHIHFFQSGGLFTRPDGLDLRHVKSYEDEFDDIKQSLSDLFRRYIACGITGVVDDGGPFWNFQVKTDAEKAEIAPVVEVAGPLVSTVSREQLDLGDPPIIKAESPEHARKLVRACVEHDPVFIKLWYIFIDDTFEQDSKIMEAAIDETHQHGYRVAVHATELETAKRAVRYGADILVHSVFDKEVDDEFIDMVKSNNVIYIPTLMVRNGYRDVFRTRLFLTHFEQVWGDPDVIATFGQLAQIDPEQIPESHRELIKEYDDDPENLNENSLVSLEKLANAGVTIATGTDAGNVGTLHGPSLHTEIELMNSAGMEPAEIINAMTINGARVMGRNDIGSIEVGKRADLVLLDANPLDDIANTQEIYGTVKDGVFHKPETLVEPFDPVSVVDAQLEAYNSRDIEAFLDCYHPHVRIYTFGTNELRMDGLSEMRDRYSKLFDSSPDLQAMITNRITLGNMVIDHEKVSGFRGEQTIEAIAYYEIRHQKITRVWFSQ